jgi:hypothetical protein
VLSADDADYQDFRGYGVMFSSRIVQKIDGRVVADLTVTDAGQSDISDAEGIDAEIASP